MGVWIVGVKPCTGDLPKLRKTLLNKSDGVCLENFIVIESGDITDKWIQVEKKKKDTTNQPHTLFLAYCGCMFVGKFGQ